MNKILDIQDRVMHLYKSGRSEPDIELPLALQVKQWTWYSKQYSDAAKSLSEAAPMLWLQCLHLSGLSVELAIKSCLLSAGAKVPNEHDLVKLYCLAANAGFSVSELEQAFIVHLSHFYHQDLATETKYKVRYPTKRAEYLGGAVPECQEFESLAKWLCTQAELKSAEGSSGGNA